MAYLTAKLNKIISKDVKFNKIISCLDNVCEIDVYEFKCDLNYFCESLKRWFDDTNIFFMFDDTNIYLEFFMRQYMQYPKEFEFTVRDLM